MNEYKQVVKRIKTGLKNRTGKNWSVTFGRGSSLWITIQALPSNRVNHEPIEGKAQNFGLPFSERVLEVAKVKGEDAYYTSEADCLLLAEALGLDRVHYQGKTFEWKHRNFYIDRAENGYTPPVIEEVEEIIYIEPVAAPIITKEQVEVFADEVIEKEIETGNFIEAKLPHLNKNCYLEEYTEQLDSEKNYALIRCIIEAKVTLTEEQYKAYTEGNLMESYDFLDGLGGNSTTVEGLPNEIFQFTDEDKAAYRKGVYTYVILIQAPNCQDLLVDPQGSSYARYMAFPIQPISKVETPKEIIISPFDIEIEEVEVMEVEFNKTAIEIEEVKPTNPLVKLAQDFLNLGKSSSEVLSLLMTQLPITEALQTLNLAQ